LADDGGWYFLRQFDTDLWWVGVSAGQLYPGLQFCNVYHASVDGLDITGDWSDVPRGVTSNGGSLTLALGEDNLLHKISDTGGFGASTWQRPLSVPWPVISVAEALQRTLKNVVGNPDTTEKQTLADNLQLLKAPVTVFASIVSDNDIHPTANPVYVTYPNDSNSPQQSYTYNEFICLNESWLIPGALRGQNDCDATFMMLCDTSWIDRVPHFFDEVEEYHDTIYQSVTDENFEGEMLMYGRSADCNDEGAETRPAIFPGWAEQADSSVLFNGKPISITNFLSEIYVTVAVRVTGALVFDTGHSSNKLEIHPVYSVDKITATFSGLSGVWADDVGNTYYLRHDSTDNTVWYVGLSPLGSAAFAQVFHGTFYPAPASKLPEAVSEDSVAPAPKPDFPVTPQNILTGDAVAIDLGWGTAPPIEASGTRLGDTGPMTFEFGSADLGSASGNLTAGNIPALSMGDFRLIKLYDA
jgi:hypothetical protein